MRHAFLSMTPILAGGLLAAGPSTARAGAQSGMATAPRALRVLELEGTPHERGVQHGRELSVPIRTIVGRWKKQLERDYQMPAGEFASGQTYILGGPEKMVSLECSAGKKVPFVPVEGAAVSYHTNHPLRNDDLVSGATAIGAYHCGRFDLLEKTLGPGRTAPSLETFEKLLSTPPIAHPTTYACTLMVLGPRPELHIAPGRPDRFAFEVLRFD